jgi:DNA-directed RNA polymerase subunit A'
VIILEIQNELEGVRFSIFSPEMIRKMSAAKIIVPDTYDDDGYPIDSGLVDTRLGVVDPGLKCKTCGGRLKECPGHFGHIELVRPVIHVEFVKQIFYILKSTCPGCHRLLSAEVKPIAHIEEEEAGEKEMKTEEKASAKAAFEVPSILDEEPKEGGGEEKAKEEKKKEPATEKEKAEKAKRNCPHCGENLPEIKLLKPTTFLKDGEPMLPSDVRDWLASLKDADIRALGFDPIYSRPEWMVITVLPVPPVNVRPSITLETGERSEDDLTHKLVDIIRINQKLEANINAGAPQLIIEDLWELLQYHVTTYFDNETANIPPARHRSGRALKTLAQRLKGKEGRFRYNLSGKRVNFSARTVISPDPRISLNEVGVPYAIAEEMSVPVAVTEWNIEDMKAYILSDKYPII